MRQIISFTLAFLFLFISAQAQDESSTPQKIGGLTSFYAELGGPGIHDDQGPVARVCSEGAFVCCANIYEVNAGYEGQPYYRFYME
jgi:hypothetical protein